MPATFTRAYNAIANSTLWFVHHLLYDTALKPVFDRQWWETYRAVNRRFADAAARSENSAACAEELSLVRNETSSALKRSM